MPIHFDNIKFVFEKASRCNRKVSIYAVLKNIAVHINTKVCTPSFNRYHRNTKKLFIEMKRKKYNDACHNSQYVVIVLCVYEIIRHSKRTVEYRSESGLSFFIRTYGVGSINIYACDPTNSKIDLRFVLK